MAYQVNDLKKWEYLTSIFSCQLINAKYTQPGKGVGFIHMLSHSLFIYESNCKLGLSFFVAVIAIESVKKSLENPPQDWIGDPCLPSQYSWTGLTCSKGPRIRVVSL